MIPLRTPEGKLVAYVEVQQDAALPAPVEDELRGFDVGDAADRLRDAGAAIGETCDAVIGQLHKRLEAARPDEVTLEFGVSLSGEVGIPVISKASAEAALKVTVTWRGAKE